MHSKFDIMPCNIQIITKYMIVVETVMLNQLKITSAKNVCILQSNTSFCVSSCKDCIFVQSIYLFKNMLLETTQQKLHRKCFNIKILIIEKVKHIYRKFALLFNMPIYVNKYYCT